MNQAFTTSAFEWLARRGESNGEYVGDHVRSWNADASERIPTVLQSYLLAGIAGKADQLGSSTPLKQFRYFLNSLAWPLDAGQCLYDTGDLLDWSTPDMRDTISADTIEQALHAGMRLLLVQAETQAGFGLFAGSCLNGLRNSSTSLPGYVRLSPTLLTYPAQGDQLSTGTAMANLARRCGHSFTCLQLGVQEAINPKSAWVEASALGMNALTLAACEPDLLLLYLRNFCSEVDDVLLSIDLDVLNEPYAGGEHRRTSFGLSLEVLLPAVRWLAGEGKLLGIEFTGLGLGENHDDQRPRLAASMTQDVLSHWF